MLADLTSPAIETRQYRCGRWAAVLRAGASISAHPRPEAMELIPAPRNRFIVAADASGRKVKPMLVDPEDGARPGAWRRLADMVTGRHAPPPAVDILTTVAADTGDSEEGVR